jgi:hypothetical protein
MARYDIAYSGSPGTGSVEADTVEELRSEIDDLIQKGYKDLDITILREDGAEIPVNDLPMEEWNEMPKQK